MTRSVLEFMKWASITTSNFQKVSKPTLLMWVFIQMSQMAWRPRVCSWRAAGTFDTARAWRNVCNDHCKESVCSASSGPALISESTPDCFALVMSLLCEEAPGDDDTLSKVSCTCCKAVPYRFKGCIFHCGACCMLEWRICSDYHLYFSFQNSWYWMYWPLVCGNEVPLSDYMLICMFTCGKKETGFFFCHKAEIWYTL